jgi:putative transcriptional regulator
VPDCSEICHGDKTKIQNDAFAAIHASAAALQKVGAIDMTTMRQFDASCLATPAALEPLVGV